MTHAYLGMGSEQSCLSNEQLCLPGDGAPISPAEEKQLHDMLISAGQEHLFEGWSAEGEDSEAKTQFYTQVRAPLLWRLALEFEMCRFSVFVCRSKG